MRNLANVVLNPTPSILTVTVRQAKTDPHDGHVVSTRGKVVFVDLAGAIAVLPRASASSMLKEVPHDCVRCAGAERESKSGVVGSAAKEARHINLSLLTLVGALMDAAK